MRYIAVTTTLSKEALKTSSPSLIRNEIGSVSLHDILRGGSNGYNEKKQGNQFLFPSTQTSAAELTERTDNGAMQHQISFCPCCHMIQVMAHTSVPYYFQPPFDHCHPHFSPHNEGD